MRVRRVEEFEKVMLLVVAHLVYLGHCPCESWLFS
jgi:hypothetical protein